MSEWQPIETAPKDGAYILVIIAGNHPDNNDPYVPIVVQWSQKHKFWVTPDEENELMAYYAPTHWMPLPEPPEAA